jgi:hypothetical protein
MLAVIQKSGSWIIYHAGRRGAFLAFLTVLDIVYGYSLIVLPRASLHLSLVLPLHAWGWIWVGTAVCCASGIFLQRDRVPYAIAALVKTAWGLTFAWLWYQGLPEWPSVVIWLSFALVVILVAGWPEKTVFADPKLPRISEKL